VGKRWIDERKTSAQARRLKTLTRNDETRKRTASAGEKEIRPAHRSGDRTEGAERKSRAGDNYAETRVRAAELVAELEKSAQTKTNPSEMKWGTPDEETHPQI
jgi:hypothetical protein